MLPCARNLWSAEAEHPEPTPDTPLGRSGSPASYGVAVPFPAIFSFFTTAVLAL